MGQFGLPNKAPQSIAEFYPSSITWTCYYTGWYRLSALGAGGSGGAIYRSAANFGSATGGGGGAFAEKEVYLIVGDTLTIVVGAGGARTASTVDVTGVNGNDGGETTIHGASGSDICLAINIHAGGGGHGHFAIINGEAITGGVGGTVSGNYDLGFAGGAGGDALHTSAYRNASGGGSSGSPYGIGGRGGHSKRTTAHANTGGGGIAGNHGGDITATATFTHGASSFESAPNNADGVSGNAPRNKIGIRTNAGIISPPRYGGGLTLNTTFWPAGLESSSNPFRAITSGVQTISESGVGCGGGADSDGSAYSSPAFGGSAGCRLATPAGGGLLTGIGGGSGGITNGNACTSAAGGEGIVAIERIG